MRYGTLSIFGFFRLVLIMGLSWSCSGRGSGQALVSTGGDFVATLGGPSTRGPSGSIVDRHQFLKVDGSNITNQNGAPVQLRGVATNDLTRFGRIYNKDSIRWLLDDWRISIFRVSINLDRAPFLEGVTVRAKLEEIIRASIELGVYLIVEWEILPETSSGSGIQRAKTFFSDLGERYGKIPNILYEIHFDSKASSSNQNDFRTLALPLIQVIRTKAPQSIIMVSGGSEFQSSIDSFSSELKLQQNILYSLRIDSNSAPQLTDEFLNSLIDKAVPFFVSQWSIDTEPEKAAGWLDFFDAKGIGYVAWSLSDGLEPSRLLNPGANPQGQWGPKSVSQRGIFVRSRLRAQTPFSGFNPIPPASIGSLPGGSDGNKNPGDGLAGGSGKGGLGSGIDNSPGSLPEVITFTDPEPKDPMMPPPSTGGTPAPMPDPGTLPPRPGGGGSGKVGYDKIAPLLSKSCAPCHGPGGRSPEMGTYAQARGIGNEIVSHSTGAKPSMPPSGPLSSADQALLTSWKEGGFLEKSN